MSDSRLDIQFYTPQEVADMLRLRVTTVYEYIRMGKLKAARFGNRYRISQEDVQGFIEYMKSFSGGRSQ
ncbi:helix-turn-helix domain-containing protein [Alicyclobacillus kakegawensis]|uniref:helix-turn-helix domain-containing protein n=1 Tax=Alicyclobacillus kakegawensis TaxID=392012 RepID=UPI00082BC2FE|nr:helix-turn-helix domain-containing protein [Alicyclobacillus kakegawensis]